MGKPMSPGSSRLSTDELLASQIAYYRAHAVRYDDWWRQERRHDLGERFRSKWESEIARVRTFVNGLAPLGDVLELAGGTGNWTAELATLADSVTVVDASPEVVAIARTKVAPATVSWIVEDIFAFRPPRRYDTVFFSFWLSHVPGDRFEEFWSLVDRCLSPGGRAVFVDNGHPSLSAGVPELEQMRQGSTDTTLAGIDGTTDLVTGVSTRVAADGRTYDLVKIWWEPDELRDALASFGWRVRISTTDWAFLYGEGTKVA